jgi:hypothetical protein
VKLTENNDAVPLKGHFTVPGVRALDVATTGNKEQGQGRG